MYRKPIFDAVRAMLERGFKPGEIKALDLACDLAEAAVHEVEPEKASKPAPIPASSHVLGSLSEQYESGGKGPGVVSSGQGDPGGISYGVYQLSTNAGTLTSFLKVEGKPWASEIGVKKPGSPAFSAAWKAIAAREPAVFRSAQHGFIERSHYRPVVHAVLSAKGLDLDFRSDAVRDVIWSMAVQHSKAAIIIVGAVDAVDPKIGRDNPGYDRALIEALYKARVAYVVQVAGNPKLSKNERDQLISITKNRYPAELAAALQMLGASPAPTATPSVAEAPGKDNSTIDGNLVARDNGVDVKSAAVKISKLHPKMAQVIVAVAKAAKKLALPRPVITSGNDSAHMKGSLHYQWQALDFRGNNIKTSVGKLFADEVATALGKDYDVAFEVFLNASNNHLHVEFDPR